MAHLLWRHRKTQTVLIAPQWIQAVLFPTIVLVGTLLGRYRGTDWPGCPDRFPAAPLFTSGSDADFAYSHRNATIGSTFVARSAGM